MVIKKAPFDFDSLCFALNYLAKYKMFPSGEEELFTTVHGFSNYEISNYGRLRSKLSGALLKPDISGDYLRYTLCNSSLMKRESAHRLVAIHFISNPENKPFVNHILGIKDYCYYKHLEWATPSENSKHALLHGLFVPVKGLVGSLNAKSKPVIQLDLQSNEIKVWESANLAAVSLNLNPRSIGEVCRGGRKKKHGGFLWKFKN